MIYADVNIKSISAEEYKKWYHLMNEKKKNHINKFHHEDDKKRSIAGEKLIKETISKKLDLKAEEIVLDTGKNGKPYAVGLDIEFNISHSDNLVVCAVNDTPVGIDVEKIRPVSLKISKKFFTAAEQIYLFDKTPAEEDFNTEPDEAQLKRFFEIWTSKEAFLKYTGKGLCENLNSVDIDKTRLEQKHKDGYIISIYC